MDAAADPLRAVRPWVSRLRRLVIYHCLGTRSVRVDFVRGGLFWSSRAHSTLRNRARSFFALAQSRHSLGLAASRPPQRCAISSDRIVRESESRRGHDDVAAAAGRQGAAADSYLAARRPSVTAPPGELRARLVLMSRTNGRSSTRIRFMFTVFANRTIPIAPPFVWGQRERPRSHSVGTRLALTRQSSELWLGAYTPCTTHNIPNVRAYLSIVQRRL